MIAVRRRARHCGRRCRKPIATGDAFTVTAGCDKRFATCRARFANAENFRGFPHIPGNDFVIALPDDGRGRATRRTHAGRSQLASGFEQANSSVSD